MNENKKIAKNSIILYLKQIITTIIGLYTTRIILLELGAENYGLYAVVGGLVIMMGFFNTAMLATTYRFIAIEIGKGNKGEINKVFNSAFTIHLVLAFFLIIIVETFGVWYVKNYLNIPISKIPDALFILHFSIISTAFSIVSVPFQGLISAKEKFIIRASFEILGDFLKLGLVLFLLLFIGNKLRAYAIIMAIVIIVPSITFIVYCFIKDYSEVKWNINKKKSDYIEMVGFTGWIIIGAVAHLGVRQGAAIIINLFFGTVLNAAFGIASQIYNYIMIFVQNLNHAAVPQIMKSYSSGNSVRSLSLVYSVSKYAFFLMLIPSVPIALSIDTILLLWLKEVPEFTKLFTILMIINGLIGVIGSGFDAAIQATGKIRQTQIWYSGIMLATLPISYLMFKLNYQPYTITIVTIAATAISLFIKSRILAQLTNFNGLEYFFKTIKPALFVLLLTLPQLFFRKIFGQGFFSIIIFSIISVVLILLTIYLVGLTKDEKQVIHYYFKK